MTAIILCNLTSNALTQMVGRCLGSWAQQASHLPLFATYDDDR
jgi:hypothetical protein